ncbi:unnamed protein product, partial [Dovyalis caffra]
LEMYVVFISIGSHSITANFAQKINRSVTISSDLLPKRGTFEKCRLDGSESKVRLFLEKACRKSSKVV